MTMLSFRADDSEATDLAEWAGRLDIDRSELLRRALHAYLTRLRSEADAVTWEMTPVTDAELSFTEIEDWGPAEDWSDWADAAR